jgi:ABC-type amino acid transport substrate-binding protein
MKGRACRVTALLLFAVFGAAEAAPAAKIQTLAPGILRVGTYFVNPPFEYLSKGRKVGFEVDLVNAIARRLHLRPLFVNTQREVILQQMQDDRYDCVVGGITITPARQEVLAWSDPYMTTTLSLVTDTLRSPEIRGFADLRDATVGVQAATTGHNAAISMQMRREIKDVKVYAFDQIADAIRDLTAGRINAVMKVYPAAAWLARQTPGLRIVAQVPYDPQPLGIGLNKNNPGLVAAVNARLAEIIEDGTYARLAQKWHVP